MLLGLRREVGKCQYVHDHGLAKDGDNSAPAKNVADVIRNDSPEDEKQRFHSRRKREELAANIFEKVATEVSSENSDRDRPEEDIADVNRDIPELLRYELSQNGKTILSIAACLG